jgi:virulence-associated protein VapD
MAYYIFKSAKKAEQYNTDCVKAHGHHDSTQRWDQVRKHPTLYKYAITQGSVIANNTQLVNELSEDWKEPLEI